MATELTHIVPGTIKVYVDSKIAEAEARRGDGSGGDGMEARIARLESHVENIQSDVSEIKIDLRSLFRFFIGGFVTLAIGLSGIMAKGFGWL